MKKITLIMIVLSFGLNSRINSQKKVALTSFWVSKHIGFEQIGGNASLVAAIASLSEDPNFNLQPVLDNFYKTFTEDYSENFPFELMSEKGLIIFVFFFKTSIIVVRLLQCVKSYSIMNDT